MRVNSEFISNEIDESELQKEKDSEQRIWTWRGIVIDLREDHENGFDWTVSIWNPLQMKLMKVNCKMKNIPNKEFEHDEEWQELVRSQNIESISCLMNP
jgi:hypothetical protein